MYNAEAEIRIADIIEESIVDGPGIRMTVFTQGCPHHCEGCHNPQTHPFDGGRLIAVREILKIFRKNPLLSGLTLSGGEPFCQAEVCAELAAGVKELGKNVIVYSGYTFEYLYGKSTSDKGIDRLLRTADILIDGRFILTLRSLELRFKGSSNQRTIDLRKSTETGRAEETVI